MKLFFLLASLSLSAAVDPRRIEMDIERLERDISSSFPTADSSLGALLSTGGKAKMGLESAIGMQDKGKWGAKGRLESSSDSTGGAGGDENDGTLSSSDASASSDASSDASSSDASDASSSSSLGDIVRGAKNLQYQAVRNLKVTNPLRQSVEGQVQHAAAESLSVPETLCGKGKESVEFRRFVASSLQGFLRKARGPELEVSRDVTSRIGVWSRALINAGGKPNGFGAGGGGGGRSRPPPPVPMPDVRTGASYDYHKECLAVRGGIGCAYADECSGLTIAGKCSGGRDIKCCVDPDVADGGEEENGRVTTATMDLLISMGDDETLSSPAHRHIEAVADHLDSRAAASSTSFLSGDALRSGYNDIAHHIAGRWERTRDARRIVAGTKGQEQEQEQEQYDQEQQAQDLLYEAVEHQTTGAGVTVPGGVIDLTALRLNPHLASSRGETMSFGEVIGLAGDFYGRPDCSISVGPIKGGPTRPRDSVGPSPGDVVRAKVYERCGWGEYVPTKATPCPSDSAPPAETQDGAEELPEEEGQGQGQGQGQGGENSGSESSSVKAAVKRRFMYAFESLYNLDPNSRNRDMTGKRQLAEVRRLVDQERRWVGTGPMTHRSVRYLSAGGVMITDYTVATGGEIANAPIVGRIPLGGLFMDLAATNADHFSERGNSRRAYEAGHAIALELAAAAKATGSRETLEQAFLADAFACHFLTDMFASGHVRTQRWAMHEAADPADVGDMFSEQSHAEDNWYGLKLRSEAHPEGWFAQGDLLYFNETNALNRERISEAVGASVAEVAHAYAQGAIFDSGMPRFFPTVHPDETSQPLCKVDPSTSQFELRDNIEDPLSPAQHYRALGGWFSATSSIQAVTSGGQQSVDLGITRARLSAVVGNRYYLFKAKFPRVAPPADLDARRLIQAFHGVQSGLVGHESGGALQVLAHRAMTLLGLVTEDTGTIVEILHLRTPQQLAAVVAQFPRTLDERLRGVTAFGDSLPRTVRASIEAEFTTKRSLKQLLLTMLTRADRGEPSTPVADQAKVLYDNYEGCLIKVLQCPDRERMFFDILGRNSHAKNGELLRAYDAGSFLSLREVIRRAFSGDVASALLMTLPQQEFDRNPERSWARLIHEALSNNGGTIFTRFIPLGTDEAKLAYALGAIPNAHLSGVKRAYKTLYGSELKQAVHGDTSGNFEALMDVLLEDKVEAPLSPAARMSHARALGRALELGGENDVLLEEEGEQEQEAMQVEMDLLAQSGSRDRQQWGSDPCDCSGDITHGAYRPNWHTANCNKWGESYDWCYVEGGSRCATARKSGDSDHYWRRCGLVHAATRAVETTRRAYDTHVAPRVQRVRESARETIREMGEGIRDARDKISETIDTAVDRSIATVRSATCGKCGPFRDHLANLSRENRAAVAEAFAQRYGKQLGDQAQREFGEGDDYGSAIQALLR